MASFGEELRLLRERHNLTQRELAESLGGELSRTTIANVETGRQAPSSRLWASLQAQFHEDSAQLADAYEVARTRPGRTARDLASEDGPMLGGYVSIERYDIIYNFRDSQAPEEVIELRRVRATRNGAHDYGLSHGHTGNDRFEQSTEVLFGGQLTTSQRQTVDGRTHYARRIRFDRVLSRGENHEFAVRYWVERDPEPADVISVQMTIPAQLVVVHANFWGRHRPELVWYFGPLVDRDLIPGPPTVGNRLRCDRTASAWFERPETGSVFGVGWRWPP